MTSGQDNDTSRQDDDASSRVSGWPGMFAIAFVCILVVGTGATAGTSVAVDSVTGYEIESGDESDLSFVQDDGVVNRTKFVGGAPGDRLGQAVAAAGDVNGDGVDDLLIGSPTNDSGGSNVGAVYLFYGPVERSEQNASAADVTFVGESEDDRAGLALAAGDVNGDGFSDVVIGAPRADDGGAGAGAAYVVYGGDELAGETSLSEADAKLVGESPGSSAGFSVSARDVDAPGDRSILVGAPTNASASRTGSAYLLSSESLSGETSLSEADAKLVGEADGDATGWAVSWVGDVTDDGTEDVLVGAPGHDASTGDSAGAAYVVGSDVDDVSSAAEVSSAKLVGANESDSLGFSVAGAGDVNGDGVGDLLVGAPFNDRRESSAGAGYVFFGSESLAGTVDAADADVDAYGEASGDRFGWSVSGVGDVNCDGYADVLVGAPYQNSTAADAGAAYLMLGRSAADSLAVSKLSGGSEDDLAGYDVAGAGGVIGDRGDDIVIGVPLNENPGGGAAYLLAGACPDSADA